MKLATYRKKRRFHATPEPKGLPVRPGAQARRRGKKNAGRSGRGGLKFVVQKHAASRLHYDFRLELDGVLKSWAVPKGPSVNPKDKRLAMHVEDHPLDYLTFEGTIPAGEYGAGDVIVWDIGTYKPEADAKTRNKQEAVLRDDYEKGRLKIVLDGKKLRGSFALVRTARQQGDKEQWLLIKHADAFASTEDVTEDESSVLSKKRLADRSRSKKTALPAFFKPMLATLADKPFDRNNWLFELKWDGYRCLSFIDGKNIRLYSRNENIFNNKFPSIARALQRFSKHQIIFDGEIVALDKQGRPDFQTLQNSDREPANIAYIIFDVLYLDGQDLRPYPLSERKTLLAELLKKPPARILYSDHVKTKGKRLFREATRRGLEGIIAKDGNGRYETATRSAGWLKIKSVRRQEAVIAGFTEPRGSRKKFGALVLGVYEGRRLRYIGHTGGGFDDRTLALVYERLKPLVTKTSPFKKPITTNAPVTWVKPRLVAEVKFSEWTSDGIMRQPVFIALREDKPAGEIVRERAAGTANADRSRLSLTNQEKVFWPKEGYTKGDIISYYEKIAPTILPYLQDRPESMLRQPDGINDKGFFQKNVTFAVPEFVRLEPIKSESENKIRKYLVCDNVETLLYMANLGCIELNPWNSRMGSLRKPDYMILDLDPAKKNFNDLVKVAQEVRNVLTLACQKSYCKTSGKRGLHIFVPLGAQYDYDQIRQFAELIAGLVHHRLPGLTSIVRSPAKRKGNIYLDYLQNRYAQTLAAPYCLRPWPGATVSTPLKWDEVKSGLNPGKFNIKTIHHRLKRLGDLWEPLREEAVDLEESIACLQKEWKTLRG